jgi:hypothetical protein
MMKECALYCAVLCFSVAAVAFAQDAAKVDPTHYKVEFENAQVRILRFHYGPHEKSVMHSHPDSVAVFLTETFYIETFGCQMNFHDSEKVVGTLISEGYQQVQREEDADLIFYNTCSIRDKAEQKVFHRLNDFKKLHKEGKRFGVLGCVAQQEGEKIFERAPYVSLVAGSASYRNLPEMLVQIEAGAGAGASPAWTTARPTRPSRPSSPRAPIRIAATSPSSRAATSFAPTALCLTRAARSAAALAVGAGTRPGAWLTTATPIFNCSGRM